MPKKMVQNGKPNNRRLIKIKMKVIGYILIVLAVLDFTLHMLRIYDITGWQYTPLVAGIVGSFLVNRGNEAQNETE